VIVGRRRVLLLMEEGAGRGPCVVLRVDESMAIAAALRSEAEILSWSPERAETSDA
jgi:hypothetical protein